MKLHAELTENSIAAAQRSQGLSFRDESITTLSQLKNKRKRHGRDKKRGEWRRLDKRNRGPIQGSYGSVDITRRRHGKEKKKKEWM